MSALLLTVIALPALGALALPLARDERSARLLSQGVAAATLALTSLVALAFARSEGVELVSVGPTLPGVGARWQLGVDGLAAPFLPLASGLALGVLVAAPRAEMDRRAARAVLLSLAATLGVYCSLDLLVLTAFWIASLVPGAMELHRTPSSGRARLARMFDVYLVLGSLPILGATMLVGWTRAGLGEALPFDLTGGTPVPVPLGAQHLVFALLALAVLIRKAILPFHSWLPVLLERGPVGIAMMIAGAHLGAFLVARVMIPLLPDASRAHLPLLAGLALVSALYCAFVALGQRDLRRIVGFVVTSQLGMVLAGLAGVDALSMHGAMLQMLAVSLTATGLVVITAGIEARCGTGDVQRLGGLARRFPAMATTFFLLGLAAIGLPGTLQYVAEDLLLHGLLDSHPVVATVLVLTTALNGITLLRTFFATFLGEARDASLLGPELRDLLPRELAVVLGAVAIVIAAGLAPSPLLDVRRDAVRALATDEPHGEPHAPALRSSSARRAR